MRSRILKALSVVLLLCAGPNACVEPTMLAEGGIGGTGISYGPISGFGSIYVNGVRFDTDVAEVIIDGEPMTEAQLQPGMVVRVYGDLDETGEEGVAHKVEFSYDLRFVEVTAINRTQGSFVAGGQFVETDELTVFDGSSFSQFNVGEWVSVSGQRVAGDKFVARYVIKQPAPVFEEVSDVSNASGLDGHLELDPVAAPTHVTIDGEVAELDLVAKTFRMGSQLISFATLPLDELQIHEGDWLRVSGTVYQGLLQADVIRESSVHSLGRQGNFLRVSGYIQSTVGNGLRVQGLDVWLNSGTTYVNGSQADVLAGARVLVIGKNEESGALLAQSLHFIPPAEARLDGRIDGINGDQLSLNGVTAQVNRSTLMLDNSNARARPFGVAQLQTGDALIVVGYDTPEGLVISRLQREDDMAISGQSIRATATQVSSAMGSFKLLNTPVLLAPASTVQLFSSSGANLSQNEFFSLLKDGVKVRAWGSWDGSSFIANKLVLTD